MKRPTAAGEGTCDFPPAVAHPVPPRAAAARRRTDRHNAPLPPDDRPRSSGCCSRSAGSHSRSSDGCPRSSDSPPRSSDGCSRSAGSRSRSSEGSDNDPMPHRQGAPAAGRRLRLPAGSSSDHPARSSRISDTSAFSPHGDPLRPLSLQETKARSTPCFST